MSEKLKVIFMGTPDLALQVLNSLLKSKHEVVAVYSQPPKPAGRGNKLTKCPVQLRAEELSIPHYCPKSLKKDAKARDEFKAIDADIAVVAAYGMLLPQDVLDAHKYGCINTHASLLPRWRGAAPINHAIWAGDDKSGVCIMQMDAGLDTGPILMQGEVPITDITTAASLYDALAEIGGDLAVKTLDKIASGNAPVPQKQSDEGSTYAAMLSKEDGRIDWSKSAVEIERQLRALNTWPGVWTLFQGKRLKVFDVEIVKASGNAGQVIAKDLTIACGKDAIKLKQVQPENKKAMDGVSFVNGAHIKVGDMFE